MKNQRNSKRNLKRSSQKSGSAKKIDWDSTTDDLAEGSREQVDKSLEHQK